MKTAYAYILTCCICPFFWDATLGYLVNGCDKLAILAANDGLSPHDFLDWFGVGKKTGVHQAQILICGNVKEY